MFPNYVQKRRPLILTYLAALCALLLAQHSKEQGIVARKLRQEKALFAKRGVAPILLAMDGKELCYLLLVFLTVQCSGGIKKHTTGL